jgi:hypothetical protein
MRMQKKVFSSVGPTTHSAGTNHTFHAREPLPDSTAWTSSATRRSTIEEVRMRLGERNGGFATGCCFLFFVCACGGYWELYSSKWVRRIDMHRKMQ